jgi:tetratricopeptide (TPR) repeat protein
LTVDVSKRKGWTARLSSYFSRNKYNPVALGDAKRNERDWPKAAGYYQRALDFNPSNQPIWIQYGHALKESGRLREAEAAYRRAVEINPRDAEARLQLGHSIKVQGNLKAAVDCYLEGYRLDSSNMSIVKELRHLGWTRSALNRVSGTRHENDGAFAALDAVTSPENIPVPANYTEVFPDVQALIAMGLVDSAEQHFAHYGFKQGRDILATFANTKPSAAFVLCPSFFKRCGIGEHSRYLANSIENSGLKTYRIRSTRDLARFDDTQLRDAVLIVNHGPGLFDGYNPELSEGEATADILTILRRYFRSHNLRPIFFMHSLLDRDNTVMFPRQQMALEYPIPVMTTIEAAARTFNIPRVEHGMQPIDCPGLPTKTPNCRDMPTIGFFGFFQWGGKNFDALFAAAERAKAKLVGSVATSNDSQVANLRAILEEKAIRCNLGTGWVEDSELAERLNEADFYYLPQQDYDHWNNSGTARFVMNFGRPVIVPPHNPFLDCDPLRFLPMITTCRRSLPTLGTRVIIVPHANA